jgi:uncharacterized membrane protein YwaF
MYGRADGMPSFQLTVAVCASFVIVLLYIQRYLYHLFSYISRRPIELSIPRIII